MGEEKCADIDISVSKFGDWSRSKSLQIKLKKGRQCLCYMRARAHAISVLTSYLNDIGGIWGDLLCFRNHVIYYQLKLGCYPAEGLQTMNGRPSYFFYGAPQIKEQRCHHYKRKEKKLNNDLKNKNSAKLKQYQRVHNEKFSSELKLPPQRPFTVLLF